MARIFEGFDFSTFWEDSDYAREAYVNQPACHALIRSVEAELGVRLPAAYLELMSIQNGGIPRNCCFPTEVPTSWAGDHVAVTGIFGIGRDKRYSLCGDLGSKFMHSEWGYPEIGICICNCPSGGHDMIMLDYRRHGISGEPEVVHVDQESDFEITFLAANFEAFIRGLVNESVYDTSAEDLQIALRKIEHGSFSASLSGLISRNGVRNFAPILRNLCSKLASEKGYFALHADELSRLVYDILFYLYTTSNQQCDKDAYLAAYPDLIAFGDGEFTTGGYAPGFLEDWICERLAEGEMITTPAGQLKFSDAFQLDVLRRSEPFQ